MSYRDDVYISVKRSFEENAQKARNLAHQRRLKLSEECPDIGVVERELSQTALAIFKAATMGGEGLQERIDEIKSRNAVLQKKRRELLVKYGYSENYFEPQYACERCSDSGIVDGKICECMKKELAKRMLQISGLGSLASKMTFDNFKLSYYSDDKEAMAGIESALRMTKRFCAEFSGKDDVSLLFIGNTGTGKTHLSVAAAAEIINRGYYVVYNTAQNLFDDFVYDKTHVSSNEGSRTEKYFDCELLVIDDLGTENITQFSISCLYNLINTRKCDGKAMIINTNLTQKDLRAKYDDRIFSRLAGEFLPYIFKGTDIRMKKLYEQY